MQTNDNPPDLTSGNDTILHKVQMLFDETGADKLPTSTIIKALDIHAKQLGGGLAKYGISSKNMRLPGNPNPVKGYLRSDVAATPVAKTKACTVSSVVGLMRTIHKPKAIDMNDGQKAIEAIHTWYFVLANNPQMLNNAKSPHSPRWLFPHKGGYVMVSRHEVMLGHSSGQRLKEGWTIPPDKLDLSSLAVCEDGSYDLFSSHYPWADTSELKRYTSLLRQVFKIPDTITKRINRADKPTFLAGM
jgi:hypothetical protein